MKDSSIQENAWFFIFSHHDRRHLDRCLRIAFRDRKFFLCARCTGILSGFLTQLFLIHTVLTYNFSTGNLLLFVLPLLPVADWITQRLSYRESVNWIRVSTGLLMGSDFAYRLIRFLNNFSDFHVLLSSALYLSAVFLAALIAFRKFHTF
jgi:uncharacterized membrane protein